MTTTRSSILRHSLLPPSRGAEGPVPLLDEHPVQNAAAIQAASAIALRITEKDRGTIGCPPRGQLTLTIPLARSRSIVA